MARGVTHLTTSESLFCKQPSPVVVAVSYGDDGIPSWNLQHARKFRNIVYETAKELKICVKCGRNQFHYNDISDYKNHYFELVL